MSNTAPALTPRAWIDILLLGLIWGGSFLAVKLALGELPVMTLVAHRVGWACLALWVWVWFRGLALPRGSAIWLALLGMGVLNNVIPFTLIAWGQQFIETGLTSIFNAATAVFGVLVAALVFQDERLTPSRALGVAIAFSGVVVAIGIGALANFDLRSAGQIATLGGALSYACAAAWGRAKLGQLAPEVAAAGMLTGASLILVPLAFLIDGAPSMPSRPVTYLSVAFVSIIATALAYLLYYRVLRVAGSGNAMLVTLIIPPISILAGALVLGERLAPQAWAGFALIALGLAVLDGRLMAKFQDARRRDTS
ncbi:MAG: DMT family transporter [Pseudomonadota bacterium]